MILKSKMLIASHVTFILLFVFAPMAFGSVEPWAFFILILLSGTAFIFYLVYCLQSGKSFYRVPGFVPLLLIGSLMIFQLVPLPESLLGLISPQSLSFREKSAGLFSTAVWPISLDITAGFDEFSRLFVCCICYILSIQLLSDGEMLKRTVLFLVIFGGGLAFASVLQSFFMPDRVLWFRAVPVNAQPFGPYVCRNHYAGLMEMIFPLALALAYVHKPSRQFGTWRERLLGFFDDDNFLLFVFLCLSALIILLSVFISLSRGGILSLCLSLLFFLTVTLRISRSRRKFGFIPINLMAFGMMILVAVWFGWEQLDQRFGGLYHSIRVVTPESRYMVLKNGWHMFSDFPAFGAGFGSFGHVFTKYHTIAPYWVVDYAHNDYLQLLTESGIAGFFLFLIFFMVILLKAIKAFNKRKDPLAVFIFAGALSGMAAIFFHSLVDFNLHVNANALYFSFLCALTVSAAHTRFRRHLPDNSYLTMFRWGKGRMISVAIVFMLLWIPLIVYAAGRWAGTHYMAPFKQVILNERTAPDIRKQMEETAAKAARAAPLEAPFKIIRGNAALAAGDFEEALKTYRQAIFLQPTRSMILQNTALTVYYSDKDIQLADTLMQAGIAFYPAQPVLYGRFAEFLFDTGRPDVARKYIRKGLKLNPYKLDMFLHSMERAGLTPAEMYAAMPDDAIVWERFAAYIANTDYRFMHKEILQKAVVAAEQEERPLSRVYLSLARLCRRENNVDEAIAVLEKGVAKLPDHTDLLYELATLYERQRITYKAASLYEKILIITPGHRAARLGLERLKKNQT